MGSVDLRKVVFLCNKKIILYFGKEDKLFLKGQLAHFFELLNRCRGPPHTQQFMNFEYVGGLIMSNIELEDDIVLAKFINYMQKALYHRRINYFRDFEKMRECEVSYNEIEDYRVKEPVTNDLSNTGVLTNKDIYLLNLHYKHGLSYTEISNITGEKICTLKQRRNRALAKLKRYMEV